MKSKIKIDLDGENRPVIRITMSEDTEDLRDSVLKRFFEGLGYQSNALFAWPILDLDGPIETRWEIRPYLTLNTDINERAPERMLAEAELFLAKTHGFKPINAVDDTLYEDALGNRWWWTGYGFLPVGQEIKNPRS